MLRFDKKSWKFQTFDELRKTSACQCGCGFDVMSIELYIIFNQLILDDYVVYVTSWNRCEIHNRYVGGAENSLHTKGLAKDVVICQMIDGKEEIVDQDEIAEFFQNSDMLIEIGLYDKGRTHIGVGRKGFWDNRSVL